jgi:hypothetical protein
VSTISTESVEAGEGRPPEQPEVLEAIRAVSEEIRRASLQMVELVDRRNALIHEAIDLYRCSQRQVARASALSVGRVHGILARD